MANSLTASAIVLCEGVPFDNSYTDTIDFSSKTEQLNYFGNFSKDGLRFANVSYQHVNYQSSTTRPAMTCRIDKYRGELENVNYLMFKIAQFIPKQRHKLVNGITHLLLK